MANECGPITGIHITERDIVEGKQGSSHYCPAARALRRKLKLAKRDYISVGTRVVSIGRYEDDGLYISCTYYVPQDLHEFILAYDAEGALPKSDWAIAHVKEMKFSLTDLEAEYAANG